MTERTPKAGRTETPVAPGATGDAANAADAANVPDAADVADVFARARAVADAVLFEGYVLYPYRASARKNQLRWQFGVLAPPGRAAALGERTVQRTVCLLEPRGAERLEIELRFLRVRRRTVERADADGPGGGHAGTHTAVPELELPDRVLVPWDEAAEERVTLHVPPAALAGPEAHRHTVRFELSGGTAYEPVTGPDGHRVVGRLVRRTARLTGEVRPVLEPLPGPYGVARLTVEVRNTTPEPGDEHPSSPVATGDGAAAGDPGSGPGPSDDERAAGRADALPCCMLGTHLLLAAPGGRFLSMTDPPEWAAPLARECRSEGAWPVLAGPAGRSDVLLSSPIILEDHAELAAESPGPLYDATEIDEILSLRTAALTEREKREARGTDPRAAEVIDLVDGLPQELAERLHGAIREFTGGTGESGGDRDPSAGGRRPAGLTLPGGSGHPWWDPQRDPEAADTPESVVVDGREVGAGSRVRLRPGLRRSDAQDLFLAGRAATVETVLRDLDGEIHLAVVVDGDPGSDVRRVQGRFLYFRPDEVVPLDERRHDDDSP
ncbi:hypothetical protein NX801_28520 [Streptomyces sp. LP05-1]|uniref:Uncharacterized protein n=1 Tax=Streptomyces pyxinae TaxID=2970734 RepID=A0ABT2CQ01_9ACTN|nr:hypothetical protein [Streptomyces sp. LP05-1]MCS0639509.1 hypothetical protein [Streptomyces sp. LP05-1]